MGPSGFFLFIAGLPFWLLMNFLIFLPESSLRPSHAKNISFPWKIWLSWLKVAVTTFCKCASSKVGRFFQGSRCSVERSFHDFTSYMKITLPFALPSGNSMLMLVAMACAKSVAGLSKKVMLDRTP